MQYYRCKCGSCESWGSDGPPQCARCSKCGSNLATHPDFHHEPKEHDFSDTAAIGKDVIEVCRYCHRTRDQVAAKEESHD